MRQQLMTADVFGNDMVLQRQKPIPIWGWACPNALVTVELAGQSGRTKAAQDGSWKMRLSAMEAGGPYTLTVQSGAEQCRFVRVYVGEVWLAGGQSNMELELQNARGGRAELAQSANSRLHFFLTPKIPFGMAQERKPSGQPVEWKVVGPDTAATLSAVAFYAGRKLANHLDGVHVGLLCCYWGGTSAASWVSRENLHKTAAGRRCVREYAALSGTKTVAEYESELSVYTETVRQWEKKASVVRARNQEAPFSEIHAAAGDYPWPPPAGRWDYRRPGNLHESMVRRICPYALRGIWYYQGEEDETRAADYDVLLGSVMAQWRADWNEKTLPFLLVQLPMYGAGIQWETLRAAQSRRAHADAHSGLVVLADCGEQENVHPVDKATPGQRLALLTLQAVYGQAVQGKSPYCTSAVCRADGVHLTFAETGGALIGKGEGRGFELQSGDGNWHSAQLILCQTKQNVAVISSPDVPCPEAVRYAWYSFGPAELYGSTGLAAEPLFRKLTVEAKKQ